LKRLRCFCCDGFSSGVPIVQGWLHFVLPLINFRLLRGRVSIVALGKSGLPEKAGKPRIAHRAKAPPKATAAPRHPERWAEKLKMK
jgi:hypothetical protein